MLPYKKELSEINTLKELKPLTLWLTKDCIEYKPILSEQELEEYKYSNKTPEKLTGRNHKKGSMVTVVSAEFFRMLPNKNYQYMKDDPKAEYKLFFADRFRGDSISRYVYDEVVLNDSILLWVLKATALRKAGQEEEENQKKLAGKASSIERVNDLKLHSKPVISNYYPGMRQEDEAILDGSVPVEIAGIPFEKHSPCTRYEKDGEKRLSSINFITKEDWSIDEYYNTMKEELHKVALELTKLHGDPDFERGSLPLMVSFSGTPQYEDMYTWKSDSFTRTISLFHWGDNEYFFHYQVKIHYPGDSK